MSNTSKDTCLLSYHPPDCLLACLSCSCHTIVPAPLEKLPECRLEEGGVEQGGESRQRQPDLRRMQAHVYLHRVCRVMQRQSLVFYNLNACQSCKPGSQTAATLHAQTGMPCQMAHPCSMSGCSILLVHLLLLLLLLHSFVMSLTDTAQDPRQQIAHSSQLLCMSSRTDASQEVKGG